jgi:exopolyphosphatase / guanosine-5'-triphosphate,3'-diphosphate pyrophosphatase
MKVAALDLGSNTFLCLIAEVISGQVTRVYSDNVEVVRLGQGLSQSKNFHSEALARADKCLQKFSEIIKEQQVEKVLAMATSAARDAENKEELFKLGQKHGIAIEIIPGEKEADITYQGAISGLKLNQKNLMVVDIGGGSTEYIFGQGPQLLAGESYDIGCVRLTEKFITQQPTTDQEVQSVMSFVEQHIQKAKNLMPDDFVLNEIIAVAGTPTTLAAAEIGRFDASAIDGFVFTDLKLKEWLKKLQKATLAEKIKMGVPDGRVDVILVGVIILLQTLKVFGLSQITVSTRGVRYGVALEMGLRFCSRA